MKVKTVENFDIYFSAEPEYESIEGLFPDDSKEQVTDTVNKIESGDLVYFCAKVTAFKNGIELASDYLGGCIYESEQSFIDSSDYFPDMVNTAVRESKEMISSLCNRVKL